MASSPTEFALQELTACWDQGYEALTRGDFNRVEKLLELADSHLQQLPPPDGDTAEEREMRKNAIEARGRLEHGMQVGLLVLRDELAQARKGKKALSGYKAPPGVGDRVQRDA